MTQKPNLADLREAVRDEPPAEPILRLAAHNDSDRRLDVPRWLDDLEIPFVEGTTGEGWDSYAIKCPFCGNGKSRECVVMQSPEGALGYKCQHASCDGRGWADLKEELGPPGPEHWPDDDNDDLIDRVPITITADEHVVNDAVFDAMRNDCTIFQRGQSLVRVVRRSLEDQRAAQITEPVGTHTILPLTPPVMSDRISRLCRFEKRIGRGWRHERPPKFAVDNLLDRGDWPGFRPLNGISEVPILRPDGSVWATPGWDEQTGMIFSPSIELPAFEDDPTDEDVEAAVNRLTAVVADFPFCEEHHKAAWLAALLSVVCRACYSGPTPLFLIDANTPGSGKTLLAELISLIVFGRQMPRASNVSTNDEWEKRILSIAMAGYPMVLVDNIAASFGCAAIDAALTSDRWSGRVLKESRMTDVPLRSIWFATGNNVILKGDTYRRVCPIRLKSPEENPDERDDFAIPDIRSYVLENRAELLGAAMTIVRHFIVSGKPQADVPSFGSFEGWSNTIRQAVIAAGLPDSVADRQSLKEDSDQDSAIARQLFTNFHLIDPEGKGVTVNEIVNCLDNTTNLSDLRDSLSARYDGDLKRPLPYFLKRYKDRVIDGLVLKTERNRTNTCVWRVEPKLLS